MQVARPESRAILTGAFWRLWSKSAQF